MTMHRGLNSTRLNAQGNTTFRERAFAEVWSLRQDKERLLESLLGANSLNGVEAYKGPMSERDTEVAATVIQWLGSPVGQGFLEEVNARIAEEATYANRFPKGSWLINKEEVVTHNNDRLTTTAPGALWEVTATSIILRQIECVATGAASTQHIVNLERNFRLATAEEIRKGERRYPVDTFVVNLHEEVDQDEVGEERTTAPGNIWRVTKEDGILREIICPATDASINPEIKELDRDFRLATADEITQARHLID